MTPADRATIAPDRTSARRAGWWARLARLEEQFFLSEDERQALHVKALAAEVARLADVVEAHGARLSRLDHGPNDDPT